MIRLASTITPNEQGYIVATSLFFGDTRVNRGNNVTFGLQIGSSKRTDTNNGFILGADKLDGKAVMIKYYSNRYFTGTELSDENGNFSDTYTLKVTTSNTDSFYIAFDTYNNRYPTEIVVDNVVYKNDRSVFMVSGLEKTIQAEHIVKISKWNAPTYPLVLSGVYVTFPIEIEREIVDFSYRSIDRENLSAPSYGIISNRGKISFFDKSGDFERMVKKYLPDKITIKTIVKNTLSTQNAIVSTSLMSDFDLDDRNVFNVNIKDHLENWQEIEIVGFDTKATATAFEIFEYLKSKTPTTYKFRPLDDMTTNWLNLSLEFVKLENSNLWAAWNKLATLASLQIFEDNLGYVVVRHSV